MTRPDVEEPTGPAPVRTAVVLAASASVLVPVAGLLTAPMLAHGLGVVGRGELGVVLSPSILAVAVATLGLPEAVTFFVAKHPRLVSRALGLALPMSALVGGLCVLATAAALPVLSTGDEELARLTLLATALLVTALPVGVIRGAAVGHQMWMAVAVERVINCSVRVVGLAALLVTGHLSVFTAMLVIQLASVVAGLAYWRLWPVVRDARRHPDRAGSFPGSLPRALLVFGSRIWLGTVAEMAVARTAQLLVAPLSSVAELGLFVVAVTVSDVPLIFALAVRDAVFGTNSRTNDPGQVTTTSRMTLLVGVLGILGLGGTMPFWLGLVFGAQFEGAVVPALILMVSALICIPGLIASAGLTSNGRPGLSSAGMALTLVVNVAGLFLLVPVLGATGAACTGVVSNVVMTTYMVTVAARTMGVPARRFVLVRPADVAWAWREAVRSARRLRTGTASRMSRRTREASGE